MIVPTHIDTIHRSSAARESRGKIQVFDPLNSSGRANTSWTALHLAETPAWAASTAQMLHATSSDRRGPSSPGSEQAITVLAHLCWVASHADKTITDVAYWSHGWPSAATATTLKRFIGVLVDHTDKLVAQHAERVSVYPMLWKCSPDC